MEIFKIEKDPEFEDVINVIGMDGAQVRYRMGTDGVLRPGRVWQGMTPPGTDDQYVVTLFIPLPDGQPEILKVRKYG